MKRLVGILALVLGGIGVLACLGGAIAVWPASQYYSEQATTLCTSAAESCNNIYKQTHQFNSRIENVESSLNNFKATAETVAMKGNQSNPADLAKIENVFSGLHTKLENVEQLIQTIQSTTDTLMTVGKLAMTVSKNPNAKERLEKIITALETAEKTVEGVKTKLVDVSDEQRLQKKAKALAVSANALLAPLTKLSNQVSELDASLVQVKSDLAEAIQAIALWKKLGPLIVTVVLIWIGIAQFCLFRCGKALLHSANPQEN